MINTSNLLILKLKCFRENIIGSESFIENDDWSLEHIEYIKQKLEKE